MNPLTIGTSTPTHNVVQNNKVVSQVLIPDNATSMNIQVYKEAGSIISGFYTVNVTTANGQTVSSIVDGQTMVLMLGAYISQQVESEFVTLFTEVQQRNDVIYAIQQLMPIIVGLQSKVAVGDSYTITGNDAATWQKYAAAAGLPPEHQDATFNSSDVTVVLDLLQNSLSDQTRAGEQQMMKLNTQASLRSTIYSLMQSNAAAFKQALSSAASS